MTYIRKESQAVYKSDYEKTALLTYTLTHGQKYCPTLDQDIP